MMRYGKVTIIHGLTKSWNIQIEPTYLMGSILFKWWWKFCMNDISTHGQQISLLWFYPATKCRSRVVPNRLKHWTVWASSCLNTFKVRFHMFKLFKHIHQILEMATLILDRRILWPCFDLSRCLNTRLNTFKQMWPGRLKCNTVMSDLM